jgi:hypothetical protein
MVSAKKAVEVVLVHEGRLDAEVGEQVGEQVDRAPVELAGRDDVFAGAGEREQGDGHGRLPRRGRERRDAVVQSCHALLEHALGGVARAAVEVARAAQGEDLAGGREALELVADGLVDGRHRRILRRPRRVPGADLRRGEAGVDRLCHCSSSPGTRPCSHGPLLCCDMSRNISRILR